MLKASLYIFDELENDSRKPIIGRELEIRTMTELFQLPELGALLGTEILKQDFLLNISEEIINELTTKVGEYRERNEAIPNRVAELIEAMNGVPYAS